MTPPCYCPDCCSPSSFLAAQNAARMARARHRRRAFQRGTPAPAHSSSSSSTSTSSSTTSSSSSSSTSTQSMSTEYQDADHHHRRLYPHLMCTASRHHNNHILCPAHHHRRQPSCCLHPSLHAHDQHCPVCRGGACHRLHASCPFCGHHHAAVSEQHDASSSQTHPHKKDHHNHPNFPILLHFIHQDGQTDVCRLFPPTFKELVRYVKCTFQMPAHPKLFFQDHLSRLHPLDSKEDFFHAVRITPNEKALTIVVGHYRQKPQKPCGCCGRTDPPPSPPPYHITDPILVQNTAPPGLRSHLVLDRPFALWNEDFPDETHDKKPQVKFTPMLKAVMKN